MRIVFNLFNWVKRKTGTNIIAGFSFQVSGPKIPLNSREITKTSVRLHRHICEKTGCRIFLYGNIIAVSDKDKVILFQTEHFTEITPFLLGLIVGKEGGFVWDQPF